MKRSSYPVQRQRRSGRRFLADPVLALRRMRENGHAQPAWPALVALGAAVGAWFALRRAAGLGVLIAQGLVDPLTNLERA
jgi:hypothetical protein